MILMWMLGILLAPTWSALAESPNVATEVMQASCPAASKGEHYPPTTIAMLEAVWGEGFLSPGGSEEVARIVGENNISGSSVLDIGCGAGGGDLALVRMHGVGYVTGLDVEDSALVHARSLIAAANLSDRIGLVKAAPGPLPFPPGSFDVVFSKEAIVHIADKYALMAEVFRVLKPGGRFIASDWLISSDEAPSEMMSAYIAAEGLDFGMASPARYSAAMAAAGFVDTRTTSRNEWYRETAKLELARLRGPVGAAVAEIVGKEFVDQNCGIWERMIPVLESGEHCPTHLFARKSL